jgi:hypothetical protein
VCWDLCLVPSKSRKKTKRPVIEELLQISIVKKGEAREPRETRELFRELALLQVPWEAFGTGFCSRLSPEREFSMEESTY